MKWLTLCLFLVGCASETKSVTPTEVPSLPAAPRPARPEPSFAAKRLAAEAGALSVVEVRFREGESEMSPLARRELIEFPREARRAQVIAWADAAYGSGDKALAAARASAACAVLGVIKCVAFNMAEKAGIVSRMFLTQTSRVKAAAAAAAPEEASRAIVLYFH